MCKNRITLVVTDGFAVGLLATCDCQEQLIVGRGDAADFALFDLRLSREHFTVRYQGNAWVVEDLGSQNGTQHNGSDVLAPTPVADGDTISAGDTQFSIVLNSVFQRVDTSENVTRRNWWSWLKTCLARKREEGAVK